MRLSIASRRSAVFASCAFAWMFAPLANADVVTQTSPFSFTHTGSVSTGLVSVGGTFVNTENAAATPLTFTRFNPSLGRLTQVTVTVTTSTATFAIQSTGLLSLLATASATRQIAYGATSGSASGGDSNQVTTSGLALLTLLGPSNVEIGGAPLAKSTAFTTAADLAQWTGSGSATVQVAASNVFSVTTLVSLLNGAGMAGSGTYSGNVTVTYTFSPWVVTGYVYRDSDHNGFRSASETGTGLTLYAKLFSQSSPSGPATQVVAVDPTTGLYTLGVQPGHRDGGRDFHQRGASAHDQPVGD